MDDNRRYFLHIDVNSAFLSWSALKLLSEGSKLDIRTVPAIVGGDQETRHGIVVAKSIPAKKYGIHTADTVASAFRKCPSLINVPPDHEYYRQMSRTMMNYLYGICPILEQVSIDECYMDINPVLKRFGTPEKAAAFIKDGIKEKLKFTVNIGISDRKVLAKMASDFQKPDRIHTLYSYEIREKLWPLPIGELYMCGKHMAEYFIRLGIKTIGDLARIDAKYANETFNKHQLMLWRFANGIDDSEVNTQQEQVKGVGNSVTLPSDLTSVRESRPILKRLSASVAGRLKKKGLLAGNICVSIRYDDFRNVSRQTQLSSNTNDENILYTESCRLFDELWNGSPVRLLGVRTGKVTDENEPRQMDLFEYQEEMKQDDRRQKLEQMLEDVRNKFGDNAIRRGGD